VHDDNKSNSGQIGQVVAMGGSQKTQDRTCASSITFVLMEAKLFSTLKVAQAFFPTIELL